MAQQFPTRSKSSNTADIGINVASTIFNDDFGWIFRRTHQEHDFGVDAYVDHVTQDNAVTGRTIAAQLKTGVSYLAASGEYHWYKDTKEHLNYFLNLQMPVLLVICDPGSRVCYWAVLDKDKIDYQENGWRFPIPKQQVLGLDSKATIEALFGLPEDHVSEFEAEHEMLSDIGEDYFIHYSVPRFAIEQGDISQLKKFVDRLANSERLALAVQGKIYLATQGYEFDSREVYRIEEVRAWAKKARANIDSWYLFAKAKKWMPSTLLWIATCTCGITSAKFKVGPKGRPGYHIQGDPDEYLAFRKQCFQGLNQDTEKWGWSLEYNYKVSKAIHLDLFPQIPFPKLKK